MCITVTEKDLRELHIRRAARVIQFKRACRMKIIHTTLLLPVLLGGCSLPHNRPADSEARQFVDSQISTNLRLIELAQKSLKQASATGYSASLPPAKPAISTPSAPEAKSIETSKPKVVDNKTPESVALTNKAKPTDLVSLKSNNNNSSSAKGNKSTIQSQTLISPTKTNKLITKNTLTSMKVTLNLKPMQTWQIEKGVTLKEGVMAWAITGSCVAPGVKNWTVYWQTPVNYQIDAPLKFSGDFKFALRSVLELYQSAKKPLYAETNTPQCVVIVKDSRF